MKRRNVVAVFLISLAVSAVAAQTRTITNADLEKYRVERVKAEQELRENYAKLGFASPEERARRDAQSAKEREQLVDKIRQERVERERIEAEREAAAQLRNAYRNQSVQIDTYYSDPYWSYFWSGGRRFRVPRGQVQQGYFAGGAFWPTGPRTRPQPMFAPRRH